MSTATAVVPGPLVQDLDGCPWMGSDQVSAQNGFVGFSYRFRGSVARLALFAADTYRCYVDGRFVNAGPVPFRAPVALVDVYDLPLDAEREEHELFILVHGFGIDTKWSLAGPAGLLAALTVDGQRRTGADDWLAHPLRCWRTEGPRISWARGVIEDVDTTHPDAAVLRRYASADYGDASSETVTPGHPVTVSENPFTTFRPRLVPALTWHAVPIPAPPRIFRDNPEVYSTADFASRLFFEHWSPAYDAELADCRVPGGTTITRQIGDRGWVLVYDLERVSSGNLSLDLTSDSRATVDLAFTERWCGDRPDPTRNGSRYHSRLRIGAGKTRFRLTGFHGFRYLVVVVKDVLGGMTIAPPGVHECHADLPYADAFASSDRLSELAYAISHRSVVLNTQATCMDCNTRELGTYWGDALWIADLVGNWSGDYRHLKHLCWGMVDEYAATGVLNSSLYGMGAPLYDYCLVPHEIMRRYYLATGDAETIRGTFATAAAIVDDHLACTDERGCVRMDRLDALYRQRTTSDFRDPLLFLDHAGLGWHPRDTIGIDRRDTNAGLNLFLLQAVQALAELAPIADVADRWSAIAAALQTAIRERFLNPATGLLADAALDDGTLVGCSQIVNALAVMTGVFNADEAPAVMQALLAIEERRDIARSTPYGWFFVAEAASRTGQTATCLRVLRDLYRPMLERGATTTWEAWGGEIHDSLNHAWSAVPPWLALRGLAGMRPTKPGHQAVSFAPTLDALEACCVSGVLPQGPWELSWTREGLRGRQVVVSLPTGVDGVIELGHGIRHRIADGGGTWSVTLP